MKNRNRTKDKPNIISSARRWCPNLACAVFLGRERLKLSPAKPRLLYPCHLGSLSVTGRQRLELTIICNRREEQQNGGYRKSYLSCSSDNPNAMRLGRSAQALFTEESSLEIDFHLPLLCHN